MTLAPAASPTAVRHASSAALAAAVAAAAHRSARHALHALTAAPSRALAATHAGARAARLDLDVGIDESLAPMPITPVEATE